LRPWSGDDEALARLSLPSEGEIARLREGEAAAQKTYETEAREAARLEDEAASLSAEIAALNKSADLVSDAEAIEIRAARDAAWARHRAELEAASADAFEQAMRRDDWSSRSRLAASADVANLRGLQQRLARCESLLNTGSARLAACEAALAARRQEIAAALPVAAPPGRDPLSFFEAWRELRSKALEARALYDEAKRALGEAQADETRARNDLLEALSAAGAPGDSAASFEAIFANAEAIVERERNHAASRAQAGERRRDLERAEKKLSTAMIADEAWQAAWRAACAQTWLGENGAMPTLGAVADALEALQDLRPLVAQRDDLMHRIATMERDRANFAHEVARCGTALGMGAGGDDVVRHSKAIEERVMRARENTRRRAEKVNALEVERASRAKVREALAINGGRTAEMTRYFGVEGLTEVAQKLDACARRDELRERRDRAAGDIVTAFQAASFAEIRLLLEAADRTALEAERTDLKANEAIEDRRVADAYASHSEIDARLRAIGGDDEVARIEEERRTILEEIKDKALSYLRTKAGVAAADGALRLYRDQHRGAMMARASDAFALISRGAYSGLTTQPNGAGETLIALAAGGGSKEVDQLSKGARFQLYLALRVAGYHEFAKTRAPAPFMADDIMETFDHFRAEEALRLFADMSRVGQVIYFTHHQHLSEIAQQVCPQARVHQLSG
jgi:uncharacterized protein YhaN